MVMLNVRRNDEVFFSCIAQNLAGTEKMNFELKILGTF